MEERLAEGTALEVADGAVEEMHAGGDIGLFGAVVAVRQDAEAALEGVDAVDIEEGQSLAAEDDFVLQDGLLDQVFVGLALILAACQGIGPALA